MSMNPGATTRSVASTVRCAGSSTSPTATTRPSLTPTSAGRPARPVPSTTVPPVISRSSMGPSLRLGSVLDLPRVVERVPRDAAGAVARPPLLLGDRFARSGRPEELDDRGPLLVDGRRAELDPELAHIGLFGVVDVGDDLVAIAAAAPGPLAQLGRRVRNDAVEHGPCRSDEVGQTGRLLGRQRPAVGGCGLAGNAEIGAAVAVEPLDHDERTGSERDA